MLEGLSQRSAARRFGIDRGTVAKMIASPAPPGYRRQMRLRRPKLADHETFIEQILEDDERAPSKQRHTARRIFERLCDERGFDGGYSTVRDYVRSRRQMRKEVFVPLAHPAGHAQADFGEATVVLGGVEQKVRFFVMDLPQSNAVFVKAYHAETAEAFCDGHVEAFAFFGGVPLSILYDNTRLAVAQILGDGTRKRSHLFAALQCHYVFDDRYGRPAKGNDKGAVEGMVGFTRRTFMVPIPHAHDIDELNAVIRERCEARQQAVLRGETITIADRLDADRVAFMDLPPVAFEACDQRPGRVSSQALVRYRNNDYSVPVDYAHREIIVKGYVDQVVIISGGDEIARHRRSYETADFIFNPLHYLPLLEKKVGALDQAAPWQGWDLPPEFGVLRRLLEARLSQKNRCAAGKREFVQVLRLLETFPVGAVHAAVKEALQLGAISADAVRHLVLARIEGRPGRLDADRYPHLPVAIVGKTRPADYMALTGAP
ncbi:MAG: IS21 family transposase [Pseudomonadota bacterium]